MGLAGTSRPPPPLIEAILFSKLRRYLLIPGLRFGGYFPSQIAPFGDAGEALELGTMRDSIAVASWPLR